MQSTYSYVKSIEYSEKQQSTIQSDLDVVEVDLRQTTVVVVDPLHGLLHVGGVWGFFRKDLEGILFYNTYVKKTGEAENKRHNQY